MSSEETWAPDDIDPQSTIGLSDGVEWVGHAVEGGLELGEVIGVGGTAHVHRAVQRSLDRSVAAKRLAASGAMGQRLLHEARITGALEHPNIVPVHDVVPDDEGELTILLKLVEGDEWGRWLSDPAGLAAQHGVTDAESWHLDVLLQVCNAVAFAHSRGVLHRDLKPANVMIGSFGEVVVTDWGLAAGVRADAPAPPSRADRIVGTPAYMAPEMFDRPGEADERTDVYLLGGLLHHVLLGHPPHTGRSVAENRAQAGAALDLPGEDALPAGRRAILERALARDPADRYASVEAFAAAVRDDRRNGASLRLTQRGRTLLAEANALDGEDRESRWQEARFAFRAALEAWPENALAGESLEQLHLDVARMRLADGDRVGARRAFEGSRTRPSELAAAIAAAEREAERLQRLAGRIDPRTGAGARFVMLVMASSTWVLIPVLGCIWSPYTVPTVEQLAGFSLMLTVGTATLAVFAFWDERSELNRRLYASLVATGPLQLLVTLGLGAMGLPPEQVQTGHFFLWGVMCTNAALFADRRLAVPALAYLVAFGVAIRYPYARYPVMLVPNLLITGVSLWIYWPEGGLHLGGADGDDAAA